MTLKQISSFLDAFSDAVLPREGGAVKRCLALCLVMQMTLFPAVSMAGPPGSPTSISGPNINLTTPAPGGHEWVVGENPGERAGSNLIHIFDRFDLDSLDAANPDNVTFDALQPTNNVINAIQDAQGSWINGGIKSGTNTGTANFYFLNPNGIVIGANAKLDIDGTFYASTADSLTFGRSGTLDVMAPTNLSVLQADPTSFGFLATNTADITVDGTRIQEVGHQFGPPPMSLIAQAHLPTLPQTLSPLP